MALAAPLLPPSVAAAARQLLVLLTTMALLMPTIARAEFTVDFEQGLEEGKNVLLEWEPVDASFRPLVLFGQLFNQTERGGMISISQNITCERAPKKVSVVGGTQHAHYACFLAVGINASSYLWMNVPSPLPFYPTASYVVQLLPQNQVGNPTDGGQQLQAPVLAQSPMFPVLPRGSVGVPDPRQDQAATRMTMY